jgi:apolipoprotein N-acyltransferase
MHPFLNQHRARLHREELLREATAAQAADMAHANTRAFWYFIFDLPILTYSAAEAPLSQAITSTKLQGQIRAIIRTIGLGAFGIGLLIGSFLGARFGLLPATLLGCIICLAISLPILRRSLKVLKQHL